MNCIVCGRESGRPVCRECTEKIIEKHPFLLRKSLLSNAFEEDLEYAVEKEMLTDLAIEQLNTMARKAFKGEKVDSILLSKAALSLHKRYGFYLENFEIEGDYYLTLAERFSHNVEGEKGKYLRYLILREKGNLKAALKVIESLVRKYGKKEYILEKARTLLELGEKDTAFMLYEDLIKEDKSVWKNLADALFETARYSEAASIYSRAIEMNARNWHAYYKLGLCMIKLGRYEEAIEHLEEAISINKYHFESYKKLLELYGELDMQEERKKLVVKLKHLGFPVGEMGE